MGFLEDALQSLGLGGFQFAAAKLGFVLQRLPAARKGLSLVLMLIRGEAAALSLELARLVLQRLTLAGYFPLRLLRSEEHTSELQSLMRISYAVFCLKKKIAHHKTIVVQ